MNSTEFWIAIAGILIAFLTLSGTFYAFIHRELKDWRADTKEEIKRIEAETRSIQEETKQQAARSDKLFEQQALQNENMAARSDKLYQMFIDLLKDERKHRTDP